MKKWFIKLLKKWLLKLGGIRRIDYAMPDSEKVYIAQIEELRQRYESVSFKRDKQSVTLEEEHQDEFEVYFKYSFKIKLGEFPSYLFKNAEYIQDNKYRFEFYIAKYKETNSYDEIQSLIWDSNVEDKPTNVSIEILNFANKNFKTIKLENCKLDNLRCFESFDYYDNGLATGFVDVIFEKKIIE